jgi:hypothetical protein
MKRLEYVVVETSYVKTPWQYNHYKLCLTVNLPILVMLYLFAPALFTAYLVTLFPDGDFTHV